jgi:hypothetical protein
LTASQDLTVTCANFMLDAVDGFIDECNRLIASVGRRYTLCRGDDSIR